MSLQEVIRVRGVPQAHLLVQLFQLSLQDTFGLTYLKVEDATTDEAPTGRDVLDALGRCDHLARAVQVRV